MNNSSQIDYSNNEFKIGKDVLKLSFAKILSTIIATVTSMLLARFRTLEEYGTYSQMLIVINLFSSIIMLGLPNSINYFLAREDNEEKKQKFLSVYYTVSTILSFLLGLSLTLSVNLIVKYYDNVLIKSFLYFLALYPWTKIITNSIEHVLVVYKKTALLIILKGCHNLLLLVVVLVCQFAKLDFSLYILIFLVIEIFITLLNYLIIARVCGRLYPYINFQILKNVFKFSLPIGLASIIGTINIELDKLIIGNYFNTEELAIYSACSAELPLAIISSAIVSVALPIMTKLLKNGNVNDAVEKWKNTIIVSFSIIVLFSIGLFTFSKEVVTLLYSEKYVPGSDVFKIYSLVLLFRCTYFGMILNSMGKTRFILYSSLASLALNIGLNFLFVNVFGFIGPALATLISTAAIALLQLLMTCAQIKIGFRKIFPWIPLGTLLMINLLLALLFYFSKEIIVKYTGLNAIIIAVVCGFAWALVYFLIVFKKIVKVFRGI